MKKEIRLEFDAISENEGLARVVVAAFLTQLDPTLEEVQDVKTAVSEAVTNAIVHGYEEHGGRIILEASLENGILEVVITDKGVGIEDVERAMQPMYTTRADSMGFAFMEAFMDRVQVTSSPGEGTSVHMWKAFKGAVLMQATVWKSTQV